MILRKLLNAEYNLCWPAMASGSTLLRDCFQCYSGKEVWETLTYTAVTTTENTYLGTATSGGMQVWKAKPKE